MTFPVRVDAVPVYAGDATTFPSYAFTAGGDPLDLSAWSDWRAVWSATRGTARATLALDTTRLREGRILLSCTSAQSRAMNGPGRWDVSAVRDGETRTFLVGSTTWREDVPSA